MFFENSKHENFVILDKNKNIPEINKKKYILHIKENGEIVRLIIKSNHQKKKILYFRETNQIIVDNRIGTGSDIFDFQRELNLLIKNYGNKDVIFAATKN